MSRAGRQTVQQQLLNVLQHPGREERLILANTDYQRSELRAVD